MEGPAAAAALALALAAGAGADPAPRCASFDLALAGLGSLEEDLARTAGLAGSAPMWPGLVRRPSGARPLWLCDGPAPLREAIADPRPLPELRLDLVPPRTLAKLHGGWADDRNDGALWAGRGLSASVSTGLRARWRWLTGQLAPLAAWQQNLSFPVPAASFPGQSPWANPFNAGMIDLPLRMGPSDFWTLDWGQSFLRADLGPFALGLSTENLWWGPGLRNSLLMTSTGPGFPHLFAGTSRPVDVWIGWLEAELFWGRLRPSRWFDGDTGSRRLFEGVVYTFAPAFQRDLTLGVARVYVFPDAAASAQDYLKPLVPPFLNLVKTGAENGPENELATIFLRWAFPAVQFETWAEWARDDFADAPTGLLMEYRNAQAWSLGLQKLFPAGRSWVRLQAEMTHTFEMPHAPTNHGTIFYTHRAEPHGYTNGGQMIGAALGPQGNTHFLAVDWLLGAGRFGVLVERTQRHERYWYDVVGPAQVAAGEPLRHDLEMSYGARGAWAFREWDLEWDAAVAHRYFLHFLEPRTALAAQLRVAWWPGRSEPPVLPGPPRPER